ncbi:MAG: ASCH domain-containing protein [Defluviitaleaceae bacterium]|nr:ASCH domain-containing protein [Defluviitaleaceae bacterium]
MTIDAFWQEFLNFAGLDGSVKYASCDYFDSNEEGAAKCLEMILAGKQRASTGSGLGRKEKLPQVGDYNIVTDWHGMPHCVIQTTTVTIMPFNEMTFKLCHREGAYDSLAAWQEDHRRYFTEMGEEAGYKFSEDMPIVFVDFEVVYIKKQ